jgi:hypothetical protein
MCNRGPFPRARAPERLGYLVPHTNLPGDRGTGTYLAILGCYLLVSYKKKEGTAGGLYRIPYSVWTYRGTLWTLPFVCVCSWR